MNKIYRFIIVFLISSVLDTYSKIGTTENPTLPSIKEINSNSIHGGVNIHHGGNYPQNMAIKISNRNLKFA